MTRSKLDVAVGGLVVAVLIVGVAVTLQTYRASTGGMGHGWTMHGVHPAWNLLGALLVAAVVGGVYLLIREQLHRGVASGEPSERLDETRSEGNSLNDEIEQEPEPVDSSEKQEAAERDVLTYLPEDERRVLRPVIESPGLTQIELRDRSDFSKSKVSQTVSALEKRGLLYRESQGRTYRVYPDDDLRPRSDR
ncbi:helix-turn-helix transcriptional regulator [Halorubrum sp. DTA46]|uniref:helix-turn-helix transcriptional regulator n=1 Tax=Halorubrum sp. DTA46 TaxID=3402162 RepID=UPI003AAD9208